jgi:hypothetical protein
MPAAIFTLLGLYLLCGFLFAMVFIFKGINKVDEGAHGSSAGFKIIIIPGIMVFWPVLMKKWIRASNQQSHD